MRVTNESPGLIKVNMYIVTPLWTVPKDFHKKGSRNYFQATGQRFACIGAACITVPLNFQADTYVSLNSAVLYT